MADILNAWVVRRKGSGGDAERVSPLGGCWEGTRLVWMKCAPKQLAGEEYSSVSSVPEHGQNGYTSKVVFRQIAVRSALAAVSLRKFLTCGRRGELR